MTELKLKQLDETSIKLVDGDRGFNYPNKSDFGSSGFCLFLDSSNLTPNGFDFSSNVFISREKDESMGNGKLQRNDVVINTRGTIGNIGHYTNDVQYNNVRINSGMLIIRGGSNFDNGFLYCFLRSNLFLSQVEKIMSGSVQNQLPIWILNYAKILDLDISTQKKIASVIASIDSKIEFNNKINTTLESLAKNIYDYWFIQFEFADENGKPYKSSGGKMTWNEELKREIPEGWNVVKLNQILKNISHTISSKEISLNTPYTPIDVLPKKKMSFGNYLSSNEAKTSLIKYNKGDILIGAMRVYFHRVCIAPFNGITRGTTLILRPLNILHTPYLYQVCNEDLMIKKATKISVGTQQPYVNWDNALENYKLPYPINDKIIDLYSLKIKEMADMIINNEIENQKLSELRDFLLPVLMNGQVKVS